MTNQNLLYITKQELIKNLDITEERFEYWQSRFTIRPIIDSNGERLYPHSWLAILLKVKALDHKLEEFDNYALKLHICLNGWSAEDVPCLYVKSH